MVTLYRTSRRARGLPATNNDVSDAIATASRFRFPATQLAEAQAAHRPKTYLYQVDWESPARRGALGACHAIEIPFVFGTVGRTGNDRMSGTGPEADRLAEQMMDAWIAFARTGEPGHDGIGSLAGVRHHGSPDDDLRSRVRRPVGAVRGGARRVGVDGQPSLITIAVNP